MNFRIGQCVGIKHSHQMYWPAVIINETECLNPMVIYQKKKNAVYLVRFFGDDSNGWYTEKEALSKFVCLEGYNFEKERKKVKNIAGLKVAFDKFDYHIELNDITEGDTDPRLGPKKSKANSGVSEKNKEERKEQKILEKRKRDEEEYKFGRKDHLEEEFDEGKQESSLYEPRKKKRKIE